MAASETKARILALLSERALPADELARVLGLSRVAVQRHLRDLLRAGKVRYQERKDGGPGRPRRYWRANRDEAACLEFCSDVLQRLREAYGGRGLLALLVEAQLDRLGPVRDRETLLARLEEAGYAPRIEGDALVQARCPRLALARAHPELCLAEAEAYARVLGRPVRLAARIPEGAAACRFLIAEGG